MASDVGAVFPRDAVAALVALFRAAWDVRTRRTGRLLSMLSADSEARPEEAPDRRRRVGPKSYELTEARRIGNAVRFVSGRVVVRPRCLVQAVAVKRLLDRRGLDGGRIRVGVRENGDDILAHAWVDFRGHVVGDFPEQVSRYTDLRGLHVHSGGSNRSEAGADAPARR